MQLFEQITRLKNEIGELEEQLQDVREKKASSQDKMIKATFARRESTLIDEIDDLRTKLEGLEAQLPKKRTNGHHPPESKEEEELKPDFKPDDKDDRKN